ncbi:MAG: ABC transporter permease [Bdellovibrionales bacterium]
MKRTCWLLSLTPAFILLLTWQLFVQNEPPRLFLFGSPGLILNVAADDLSHLSLWQDMGMTFSALVAGLTGGTFLGTVAGLALAVNPVSQKISQPYLVFLSSIQIFALAPLLIIWFGIGWSAKVAIATMATCFVALQQANQGAIEAQKNYSRYAMSLHTTKTRLVQHILLPGAFSWVLAGIRLNIGFALLGVLIGEFISSESGVGHYIFKASGVYDIPRVWLGIFLLCGMALFLSFFLGTFAKGLWGARSFRGSRIFS